jgi:phosphatidylserine/phosphatidylglycerophosphate/cardiolipin synthase-like enzyme
MGFVATYPETLARLDAHASIDVRPLDLRSLTGGVLHAKMMLIDGDDAFVGSQNFDWRALEHIQELGLRISDARLVLPLVDLFEKDWALAGGEVATPAAADYELPLRGDGWSIRPVMSPRGQLVDESLWDLPRLIEAIDGAKTQLRLQMLSYRTTSRDGSYWDELDAALRRASARGVDLRLIFSNWSTSRGSIETLQSLQTLPNIEVRITTIPEWSGGFIPFARVSHSKYLVIDEAVLWIGTSNGSRGYFYDSRNVGFLIESKSLAQRLIAYFQHTWESAYAETVDPCAQYTAPRRG